MESVIVGKLTCGFIKEVEENSERKQISCHETLKDLKSLLVLQNFTIARKGGNILFSILKGFFFVGHSSEYQTSDSDRKVNWNI